MKLRFTIALAGVVFAATVFVLPVAAQRGRIGVSASFGQTRISPRFSPRTGFTRARIGFGRFNRGQIFPGSFIYPYFYPPYFYPDYDYQEYQPIETQAPPPEVVTVQPAPAPAPPASPVESLVLENHGGQWVRVSNFGPPPAPVQPAPADSTRALAPTKLPPTVLIFRDGHNEEVERYMIQGNVIFTGANYWSTGSWTKKVPIAELDIPATIKLNEERGVKFALPSGPNQVMIRQ